MPTASDYCVPTTDFSPPYLTNAFDSGRSPVMPNCRRSGPAVELNANQFEFDRLKTAASILLV